MKALWRILGNPWLVLILILAAGLRIYHLSFQSLWLDEVLSMNDAHPKLSLQECYRSVLFWEDIPALYFFALKFWLYIFGYTASAARLLSAVIGVVGIYGMFLLGRELYGRRAGLIAALLTCLNFFHLLYSQEVRPYGLFFTFAAFSFYRLSVLIRNPGYKNAIFYGIFAGLMVNAHLMGLLAVFAQFLILLFFLIKTPQASRKRFFICSFIGGFLAMLLVLPCYEVLTDVAQLKSFWIPEPSADAFTRMFDEFFGGSELLLAVLGAVAVFYFVRLFGQKSQAEYGTIPGNKLVYSFVILFMWVFILLIIPIVKSYMQVSIILTRYFIAMLPALILVLAIGIDEIKNGVARSIVLAAVVIFSLLDLFIVKDYYNTPTKTQYRELVRDLVSKNVDDAKVVGFWTWIYPYFVPEDSKLTFEQALDIEDYVSKLRAGQVTESAFWFTDANRRPFALTAEAQAYLDEKFTLAYRLEYIDVWANYYIPKNTPKIILAPMDLKMFRRANFDNSGNIIFYNEGDVYSPLLDLERGSYELAVTGKSLPQTPIRNENAHIQVGLDGRQIGQFYLGVTNKNENIVRFSVHTTGKSRLVLSFDNDFFADGQDRNAVITSVRIQKN